MSEKQQLTVFDSIQDSQLFHYNTSINKLQKELSRFNLTSTQSKVYIFLAMHGSKTAPEVFRALKIGRTEAYQILSTLQNKGIVSCTFEHPLKFSAYSIQETIQTLINTEKEHVKTLEKQEETLIKLWDDVPKFIQENHDEKENKFQMLQGTNTINGKLKEMTANAEQELLVIGSEKDFLRLYHSDFLDNLTFKNYELKIITSCSKKTLYVFENLDRKKIRCMQEHMNVDFCFVIKDSKEMIFFVKNGDCSSQTMTAMWTNSISMINSMKLLYSFVWSSSKAFE